MAEDEDLQQLVMSYKQTFLGEHGKRVLDHMKVCAKFNIATVPTDNLGRIDVYEVMRQEGMRSVIINIEKMINKKPGESKGIQNERPETIANTSSI